MLPGCVAVVAQTLLERGGRKLPLAEPERAYHHHYHYCCLVPLTTFKYQAKSESVRLRQKVLSLIIGSVLVLGVLAHANVLVMLGQSFADAGF